MTDSHLLSLINWRYTRGLTYHQVNVSFWLGFLVYIYIITGRPSVRVTTLNSGHMLKYMCLEIYIAKKIFGVCWRFIITIQEVCL